MLPIFLKKEDPISQEHIDEIMENISTGWPLYIISNGIISKITVVNDNSIKIYYNVTEISKNYDQEEVWESVIDKLESLLEYSDLKISLK